MALIFIHYILVYLEYQKNEKVIYHAQMKYFSAFFRQALFMSDLTSLSSSLKDFVVVKDSIAFINNFDHFFIFIQLMKERRSGYHKWRTFSGHIRNPRNLL